MWLPYLINDEYRSATIFRRDAMLYFCYITCFSISPQSSRNTPPVHTHTYSTIVSPGGVPAPQLHVSMVWTSTYGSVAVMTHLDGCTVYGTCTYMFKNQYQGSQTKILVQSSSNARLCSSSSCLWACGFSIVWWHVYSVDTKLGLLRSCFVHRKFIRNKCRITHHRSN